MRFAILVTLALLMASCGQPPGSVAEAGPVEESTLSPDTETPEGPPRNVMEGRGYDFRMYDYTPTDGELRDPTFWAYVDSGQLAEGENVWSVQGVRAVIYREDEDDIVIEALEGVVDKDQKVAELRGAVHLTVGSLTADLEDLRWDNEKGTASTNHAVHLEDANMRLDAKGLLIKRDESVLILGEGSGHIRLTESTL